MKRRTSCILVCAMITFSQPVFAQTPLCPTDTPATTEITILFEFENSFYKNSWAYRSLEPKLSHKDSGRSYEPSETIFQDTKYLMRFCIDSEIPRGDTLTFFYGLRIFQIVARPTNWREVRDALTGEPRRYGRMTQIQFPKRPDPDWLIGKSAVLERTHDGKTALDIELQNPFDRPHPGVSLSVVMLENMDQCLDPANVTVIPVHVSRSASGELDVASGDPELVDELLLRDATEYASDCGTRLELDLGKTGEIEPGKRRMFFCFSDTDSLSASDSYFSRFRYAIVRFDSDGILPRRLMATQ